MHKHVTQFVCYQENDHLNLFSAVGNEIYYSEIKETDLEVNGYVLLLSRNQPCALMRYNNDVFVQSEKSVYKVIFLGENIHILPIMTQPSANIRASLPILDIQKQSSSQERYQRPTLFRYPIVSTDMGVEEKYANYKFVVLADRELQIGGKALQYDSAYNDEFDSSAGANRYYLAVSRVNLMPKYSNRRFLIKRTPVKIEHCETLRLIAVLTEQYIGKSQIRFYDEETSIEYAKIIPEHAIITDMKFIEIDGQEYFAFSRFDVDDVYEQIQEIDQIARHEQAHSTLLNTKLVLYKVYANKIEFFSELRFQENYPISTFMMVRGNVVCCIGPFIHQIQAQIPLQVTRQPAALETMIEHLISFQDCFICIRAGQVTLLDE